MKALSFKTSKKTEFIDLTDSIREAVSASGVKDGTCLVFTPHTTAGIIVNEWEPNLVKDLESFFEKAVPKGDYAHNKIDDNAEAHLKSIISGCARQFPVSGGDLVLGTWQRILLCEFDGPRARKVIVLCK